MIEKPSHAEDAMRRTQGATSHIRIGLAGSRDPTPSDGIVASWQRSIRGSLEYGESVSISKPSIDHGLPIGNTRAYLPDIWCASGRPPAGAEDD